jgi:chromosome segregation ATPase
MLRPFLAFILAALTALPEAACAAPKRPSYQDEQIILREVRDSVDELRHEVRNHEAEMRAFEEKLNTQDGRLDALLDQVESNAQSQKNMLKGETQSLDERVAALESLNKNIVADLKQLKSHANDTASIIGQYKQKLGELEKMVQAQNNSLDALQTAIQSLADAMQVKAGAIALKDDRGPGLRTYQVKAGDSLEKIARAHKTTAQAIKELNNLNKDRIVIGQTLKLPDPQ